MALRDLFRRRTNATGAPPRTGAGADTRGPGVPRRSAGERDVPALRALLRERPGHLAARLLLAERLAERRDVAGAIAEYGSVVDTWVDEDLHVKAVRLLRQMAVLAPDRADVLERLARLSAVEATLPRRDRHIARLGRRTDVGTADLGAAELRRFWNEIGASPLVVDLDDASLGWLLEACEVQRWTPQSIVVRRGQSLPRCYLVVEGGLVATKPGPRGTTIPLLRFLPGDVVGDGTLVEDLPWPAEFRTVDDQTTAALRWTRRGLTEHAGVGARLDVVLATLRRHGRDREVEAAIFREGA